MNTHELLEALSWRYATKHFDPDKKIPTNIWKILEKVLILSPSSYGLQPYKFLVVQNHELRKKLTACSWKQPQIEDCSHLVVFLAKKIMTKSYIENYIKLIAETRDISIASLEEYKNMMINSLVNGDKDIPNWAAKQAYVALGNLLTSAALLGIDACPMEGVNSEKYDEILGIGDSNYSAICVCALGFRSAKDKSQNLKKVRFNESHLVEFR